jgi:GT2 family glycosyltransferase
MARRIRVRQPDFPPPRSAAPAASVIIVTYNTGGRFIENCLEALRRLDYPNYEVIVVDNNSSDETRAVLERCRRAEKIVLNPRNRGFAGGCNDGAARANGEVLVFLNFDTEVEPSWLREIVAPMTRDRRAAIAGCKMYFPGGREIQHAGGILHGNGMSEHVGYHEQDAGQYDEERDVDYVTGAGMAVRREFFDLCGGFDEDYFPAYCEELDLCYRARLMGYRVVYAPRAVLVHHESPVVENQSPVFQRLYYRGRMIFCIKNYRLREWLFDFIPYEIHWLRACWSKGLRKKQLRAYLDGLKFLLGHRLTPEKPFPE